MRAGYVRSWLTGVWIFLFAAAFSLFLNQLFVIGQVASWSETYAAVEQDQFSQSFGMGLLLYGIFAPILEELLFRLLIQNGLNRLFRTGIRGRRIVLVVSALAFACYHGNLVQGLFAFPMGILMALLFDLTGNLMAPILFHVSANLTTWIVSDIRGFIQGSAGIWLCLIYGLMSAILGVVAIKNYSFLKKE